MKAIEKFRVVPVPKILLDRHRDLDIDQDLLITIIKLIGLNQDQINLSDLFVQSSFTRDEVAKLLASGIFELNTYNGNQYLDLNSLYEKIDLLLNNDIKFDQEIKRISNTYNKLFGHTIGTIELHILESWLENGYSVDKIIDAIRVSHMNNVDNMSYIEKVLIQKDANEN